MKKPVAVMLMIVMLSFSFSISLFSRTLWQDRNIYSSANILKTGDVILVSIKDISDLRYRFTLKNSSSSSVQSDPDVNITGFLPKVSSGSNMNRAGDAEFRSNRKYNLSIAARITEILADNQYRISGSRIYSINGVTTGISVSGILDPSLIKGRSVDSATMTDFRLDITTSQRRFGINRQALQEQEKASSELTEEEKQQIIIDYLQKVLGELTQ